MIDFVQTKHSEWHFRVTLLAGFLFSIRDLQSILLYLTTVGTKTNRLLCVGWDVLLTCWFASKLSVEATLRIALRFLCLIVSFCVLFAHRCEIGQDGFCAGEESQGLHPHDLLIRVLCHETHADSRDTCSTRHPVYPKRWKKTTNIHKWPVSAEMNFILDEKRCGAFGREGSFKSACKTSRTNAHSRKGGNYRCLWRQIFVCLFCRSDEIVRFLQHTVGSAVLGSLTLVFRFLSVLNARATLRHISSFLFVSKHVSRQPAGDLCFAVVAPFSHCHERI